MNPNQTHQHLTSQINPYYTINENRAITRGVHGSGWVGLRRFFDLTHDGELKKIRPNPTHPTHVGRVEHVKTNKETIHSSCKESLPAPNPDQYGKT